MAIAHDRLPTVLQGRIGILGQEGGQSGLHGLGDQVSGPLAQQLVNGSVTSGSGCERARRVESVMAYPLVLLEILVVINQQDTPPFLPPPVHQKSP